MQDRRSRWCNGHDVCNDLGLRHTYDQFEFFACNKVSSLTGQTQTQTSVVQKQSGIKKGCFLASYCLTTMNKVKKVHELYMIFIHVGPGLRMNVSTRNILILWKKNNHFLFQCINKKIISLFHCLTNKKSSFFVTISYCFIVTMTVQ